MQLMNFEEKEENREKGLIELVETRLKILEASTKFFEIENIRPASSFEK